jgi:hypothetical protein
MMNVLQKYYIWEKRPPNDNGELQLENCLTGF